MPPEVVKVTPKFLEEFKVKVGGSGSDGDGSGGSGSAGNQKVGWLTVSGVEGVFREVGQRPDKS